MPYQPDLDEDGPLRWAAAPILDQVADELEDTGVGLLLTDARGQVVDRRAADSGILTRLDHIELAPGFLYSEDLIGTNAIAQQAPSVVTGTEHFADAHYVASEALANVMKHAQASYVEISLAAQDGRLLLSVRDDEVGGADPARGSGRAGLADRVEALGGSIRVRSAAGAGTQITVDLPLEHGLAQSAG